MSFTTLSRHSLFTFFCLLWQTVQECSKLNYGRLILKQIQKMIEALEELQCIVKQKKQSQHQTNFSTVVCKRKSLWNLWKTKCTFTASIEINTCC